MFLATEERIVIVVSERWVGANDVATHLGVAKDSVYRWIDERGLPAHRVGRLFRFKLSEIDAWVRQDNQQDNAPNSVQDKPLSKSRKKDSASRKPSRKRGRDG